MVFRFISSHYQAICTILGVIIAVISLFVQIYDTFFKDANGSTSKAKRSNKQENNKYNHYEYNYYTFVNQYSSLPTERQATNQSGSFGTWVSLCVLFFSIVCSYYLFVLPLLILIDILLLLVLTQRLKRFNIPIGRFKFVTCARFYIPSHVLSAICLIFMMHYQSIQDFYSSFYQSQNTSLSAYISYVITGFFNGIWFEWLSVTLWICLWLLYIFISLSLFFISSSVNKEKLPFLTKLSTIFAKAWFFPLLILALLGFATLLDATIH